MFCENCGKKISKDSKFCEYCGAKFSTSGDTKIDETKKITAQDYSSNNNQLSDEAIYQIALLISEAKHVANKMMLKGIGWIIAGIVITGITYAMAEPGGTYFIFWGLSIYGVYLFIKGLYYRMMPHKLIKDTFDEGKDSSIGKEKDIKKTKKKSNLHWE